VFTFFINDVWLTHRHTQTETAFDWLYY